MLQKHWLQLTIATIVISLLSIKGFPIALGALYLPVLFKIVQLQLNLSKGLIDDINARPFIKSNQTGIIVSVLCCLIVTGILIYTLNDFYQSLTGILGYLVMLSPFTLIISAILYVLSTIAVVQAVKVKFIK
ncbi:hypothetical protein [Staphylococcus devriesei]|uniref:DUF2975 domain-containing protein n=1 Tax=Staphylococcus devriesei TaxID=586733 RepID=A0ABX5I5P0_9STAP|nr:hypothetical protein [Staphylococcus devriesei]MCE5097707.1 hypothetical protein [Staphylococcus devriesei]PNZ86787.1 hypothetical protein CD147_09610 [Staphylococcus devriesei]PTF15225.1 hypothetical protein BUY47_00150 [Staphylococcus devriesei]PTF18350.1 hypothetical protein BUY42_06975 [Staphylococcus devriesei]SUM03241.1 membrane protein [Staphylococcus devriesei]